MSSSYAKTVGGKLQLKNKRPLINHRPKRKRDTISPSAITSKTSETATELTDTQSSSSSLVKLKGSGRILSSGTTIMGQLESKFLLELAVGDAIIIQHPTLLVEETRILTMVLSDVSASISSAFSSDLISATVFHYIKAPRDESVEALDEGEMKKKKLRSDEHLAFGTYAGGTEAGSEVTFRVKKSGVYGGYQIVKEKSTAVRTREDLLDFRSKKKGDRHCN